jgi:hemolysin D
MSSSLGFNFWSAQSAQRLTLLLLAVSVIAYILRGMQQAPALKIAQFPALKSLFQALGLSSAPQFAMAAAAVEGPDPKSASSRGTQLNRPRDAVDREFLPAALELLETPPSPVKVAGIWMICCGFAALTIGAWFGTLDIHAVAQGRIHPSGRSKILQPLEPGKVVTINVENGSKVSAGDILLELDPTETAAEREAQARELEASRAETARRAVAISVVAAKSFVSKPITFPVGIDKVLQAREQRVLEAELAQFNAARASLSAQVAEQAAARNRLKTSITAREKLIGLTKERSDTRETLNSKGALSRALVIDSLQQYESQVVTLVGERGQLLETEAAILRLERKLEETNSQFITDQTQKLTEADRKADRLEQELIKAKSKSDRTFLRAPINGTVQQLAVTSIGQVVASGASLLTIVPSDGPIEIEALILNQDIGFVNVGQPAVIKVDAFPFTRYGTLEGTVIKVSRDAVDERDANQSEAGAATRGAPSTSGSGRGQNLVFPATISISTRSMMIDGKDIPLSPGMVVFAEIKTGERRAIDYVLSPLREIKSTVARQR